MVNQNFPNLLRKAQEIEVKEGNWRGTFIRTEKIAEGNHIFRRIRGTRNQEQWMLRKFHGVWAFFIKSGVKWHLRERWDPIAGLWFKPSNQATAVLIRVTKKLNTEEKKNEQKIESWSWRENLMDKIYEQGFGYDMKIRLKNGDEIQAHRAVVAAACPSWKALIESSAVESETAVIDIPDTNPTVVKAFVKALYIGEFEDLTLLPGIALMADRYKTNSLMHEIVLAIQKALETQGPEFYFEVMETLRRLPETDDIKKLKTRLYEMNKGVSQDLFYKRLGID